MSPKLRKSIRVFSIIDIILGLLSIIAQAGSLVIHFEYDLVPFGNDVIGIGIWAGGLYLTSGCFGLMSVSTQPPITRYLITAIVFSVCTIPASISAAVLSFFEGFSSPCPINCDCTSHHSFNDGPECGYLGVYIQIEWVLMGISVLALFSNIALLIVTSSIVYRSK